MSDLLISLALLVVCVLVLYQLWRGAVFVPSHKQIVKLMVDLAQIKEGMKVADLGSGDGRIVIAMAQAGAYAVGFEMNPILAWWARAKIKRLGLQQRAQIKIGDFWHADLSQFDVVTVFGIDYIMKRLEKKLQAELKPGSVVISNAFVFPTWAKSGSEHSLNIYKK